MLFCCSVMVRGPPISACAALAGGATETGAAGMEDRTAGVGRLGKVVNVTCALLSYDAAAALQ